jgi:hypothetical protein
MKGHSHFLKIAVTFCASALIGSVSNLAAASPSPSPSTAPIPKAPPAATSPESVGTNAPAASPPTNTPSATPANPKASLTTKEIPEIHAKISIPADWTLIPGKLLEGDVLLAVREKITGENDPWTTGLSMTIDRNGAKDSGMKATEYAQGIAKEAQEKAGEEASPITESTNGPFHDIRFEFPVPSDPPLQVTEVLRANEETGTVAVVLWQSPKNEASSLRDLKEAVLSGLVLDPAQ